jgi:hypothetical protein
MTYFYLFPASERDMSGFATILESQLIEEGFLPCRSMRDADLLIFLEHPRKFSSPMKSLVSSTARKVLLRFEPKAVNPILYQSSTVQMYDRVLSIGGKDHVGVPAQVIKWPYFSHPNPAKPNVGDVRETELLISESESRDGRRTIQLSMIVSNKVGWSDDSNYGLRRDLVRKSSELGIDVFGMGWQDGLISILRKNLRLFLFFLSQGVPLNPKHLFENITFTRRQGVSPIRDKFDVLKKSKFHLVVENSSSYVSEKLLDSLICGAVPIYSGPNVEEYGIPSELVLASIADYQNIKETILNLGSCDLELIRQKIQVFLNSRQGPETWSPVNVARDIIRLCR